MPCLTKLVRSVTLNLFIFLVYSRHKFHAVGGMMVCWQNHSNMFSFISIHRASWSSNILPKDKNPPQFAASEADQLMLSIGQSFDCWYVIGLFEYLWKFIILLVSPCVFIHVFTPDALILQSPIRMICSPWCIHFEISLLIYIKKNVLGSFWFFVIAIYSICWLYDLPALALVLG